MPIVEAIVLGIVQGLSEFLPISSSGHLVVVPWLFEWEGRTPDVARTFDVALHVGTFTGALAYFWRDLLTLVTREQRMGLLLLLASVPAAITGVIVDAVLDLQFESVWMVAVMLILFGLVLLAADRVRGRRESAEFRVRDALLMGGAQALALQPGVSRSGVTISMGRWLGFDRHAATRLSFLMSLPIIGGAGLYEGAEVVAEGGLPEGFVAPFAWGMLAAAVTGFFAVWGLLRLVRTRSFVPFVIYRVLLGVLILGLLASGAR